MVSFGRISPNSFLSSILLFVVVMVILVVIVVAIIGVVVEEIMIIVEITIIGIWFLAHNRALVFGPLVCELCWWLLPESEALKQ
ncbi:hypothetical protein Tco_0432007 [Tanacetum coccineum]